ncbi:Biotin-requiring enzyme [Burkholderia sp. GAS332]|nr:Biotin-requiring enzyme [Burkholderia sp. GAS332]
MNSILIANRGEIAIRIMRAARQLGIPTVAVFSRDDAASLHASFADEARELPSAGAAAYLDQDAILAVARETRCSALHPGYGFLSENADFARACVKAGINFIGPRAELLDLFGNKIRARELARDQDVPVMPGTSRPTSLDEARVFAREHGAVMLKALAGGGGRGMRAVHDPSGLEEAFERCRSEAQQAFGNGDLYIEKLLTSARHIEVQIVGDGSGAVCHLWERDCTVQRRHQKLVEIAPSPTLRPALRDRILAAATRLATHVRYESLGTFEFLVSADEFWFMEANPRLQVEHTVTEEITGVDLVQTQIRIAGGASLAELGLARTPESNGFALQVRVNLESLAADGTPLPRAGTLTAFAPPSGPNVRVDTYGYAGYKTSLRYDSLLAKVIARGRSFANACANVTGAVREFHIDGVPTNIPLLQSILAHPAFLTGEYDTSFIDHHLAKLLEDAGAQVSLTPPASAVSLMEVDRAAASSYLEAGKQDGTQTILAPMAGMVVSMHATGSSSVRRGDPLVVLEAMKMEYTVRAECDGVITAVEIGMNDAVAEGEAMFVIAPNDSEDNATSASPRPLEAEDDPGWSAETEEIRQRHEAARGMGGTEKVERQHAAGKLTARERIASLVDPESFAEIGALTGFGTYDDAGELTSLVPANFIAGTARIDRHKVVVGADDFTIRGGSGDATIHAKQIFAERYSRQMRLPMVRLLDGASGGGSVKMAQEAGYQYVPVNPGWDAVVDNLSLVPVVAACLGPTVGLGAARLVMSHLAIMVEEIGQVFTAGPPVVRGSTGEDLTKEQLGGVAVHRDNGIVERIVGTEGEAFGVLRAFLSYLPGSVFEMPPVSACDDPSDRRDAGLVKAIPRNPRSPYQIQPILDAIFDRGSFFPYAEYGGGTVTALARLDGHPVGVIATDPFKGATMSAEGAQAVTRLVDLCETFHLPIVSLTDQAGMSIGSVAERRGTIRFGARAISAVYQARVPQAEVILRRVFGVGGAGIVNRHRPGRSWSWPSGTWGSLPAQGGIEAAFRAVLEKAEDPSQEIERIRQELSQIASPFRTTEKFGVQDLIDPRESRPLLCDWVRDAYRLLPELLGRPSFGTRP